MRPFAYARVATLDEALHAAAGNSGARYIAGGTNLVDLMFDVVETPSLVIDINRLPFADVTLEAGAVRIGALARMSDTADHPDVRRIAPFVSDALNASASAQLRNMASIGGNVLQRTRCPYFRDVATPCNKRSPGSGCGALRGENRTNAILGGSDACIATHASDLAVALVASDAVLRVRGPRGERTIPIAEFYVQPHPDPRVENTLERGELITAIDVPNVAVLARSAYVKIRDRQSYEFALASAALALEVTDGVVRDVRLAIGGVGTVPWRSRAAERSLIGNPASRDAFADAADIALRGAVGRGHNDYKIALAKRAVLAAFTKVTV